MTNDRLSAPRAPLRKRTDEVTAKEWLVVLREVK